MKDNSQKIIDLFNTVLTGYERDGLTVIMEFPCDNEAQAKEDLKKEIEGYKTQLNELLDIPQKSESEGAYTVHEFGNDYVCKDFTDVDPDRTGVVVSLNDEHLGEILGISIPDPEDAEEVEKFNKEVIEWVVDNDK